MSSTERKTCAKCGRSKRVDEFFSYRDGEKCEMCKQCLCEHIDNSDPETFKWILEKFDVPYIERSWVEIANRVYKEAPSKFGPMSVIGKYMRNMKIAQYKDYRWADSDSLNALKPSATSSDDENELKRRLESGEITQAQYDTMSSTAKSSSKDVVPIFTECDDMERDVSANLTDEDRRYLINKWGTSYKASEWLKMEDMYNRYAAEYDLNVDRAETLKKMCKTSLKMDIALDSDNMLDYKSLSQVLDSLRKSGKFNVKWTV